MKYIAALILSLTAPLCLAGPLELRGVRALAPGADPADLVVILDGAENRSLTLTDGRNGAELRRDRLWLEVALERGVPIVHDPETGRVWHATVVTGLDWVLDGPDHRGRHVVSGPPRRGPLFLAEDADNRAALLGVLEQAVSRGEGAVFALRDGLWIEAARAIPPRQAMRFLGIGGGGADD